MIQRFRKKSVIIEAILFSAYQEGEEPAEWNNFKGGEVWNWLIENNVKFNLSQNDDDISYAGAYLEIETLEGIMKAQVGDWIIKGIKNEFYPCKSDIFKATYEEII